MLFSTIGHLIFDLSGWLTLRHAIVVLSLVAAAVNISSIVPQLLVMLRSRSSDGQSSLGWMLAATCSGSLLFVNAVGFHAFVLATGNLLSVTLCVTAALLARRFRTDEDSPAVLETISEEAVTEMATGEFQALAEVVLEEHFRRTTRPEFAHA
jgi:hypothetical protein